MDLSKLSTADLQALKAGDLSQVSTAGLQALKAAQTSQPDWMNEPGLEADPFSVIALPAKALGQETKAGYAGVGNLVAGNGLQQAASDVNKVESGESAETTSGKVGEFAGGLVTPAQIALQGGMGAILEASGLGEWAASLLKGWGEKAALSAIGTTKAIAKSIGLDNIPALAKFLLEPVEIGGKEFPAIVTATSDTKGMLAAAEAIKDAAGKQLGVVSEGVDAAIKAQADMGGEAKVAIDLAGLQKSVGELKAAVEDVAPNLGKAVVGQYNNAILDLNNVVKKALEGETDTVFSDLSKLKTTIGDLVYKHGNPLESKAALNDVYHAISTTLDDAAAKVGGETGPAYDLANATYHKATAVASALEGKAISAAAKNYFNDVPALIGALTASHAVAGPLGLLATPAAFVATKAAESYGPQAIAQGLNAGAPLLGSALRAGVRSLPVVGNAIASALTDEQ